MENITDDTTLKYWKENKAKFLPPKGTSITVDQMVDLINEKAQTFQIEDGKIDGIPYPVVDPDSQTKQRVSRRRARLHNALMLDASRFFGEELASDDPLRLVVLERYHLERCWEKAAYSEPKFPDEHKNAGQYKKVWPDGSPQGAAWGRTSKSQKCFEQLWMSPSLLDMLNYDEILFYVEHHMWSRP